MSDEAAVTCSFLLFLGLVLNGCAQQPPSRDTLGKNLGEGLAHAACTRPTTTL